MHVLRVCVMIEDLTTNALSYNSNPIGYSVTVDHVTLTFWTSSDKFNALPFTPAAPVCMIVLAEEDCSSSSSSPLVIVLPGLGRCGSCSFIIATSLSCHCKNDICSRVIQIIKFT